MGLSHAHPPNPTLSSQWIVVDAKVYDLSRFVNLHPGGRAVLVDGAVAGKDATEAFYGLHRHEVLERPQYARLQIGVLRGETSVITGRLIGGLSTVPYAEPTYLSEGFHSPYYTEVRRVPADPGGSCHFFIFIFVVGALLIVRNLLWVWGLFCNRITRRSRRPSESSSMRWCILTRRSARWTGSDRAKRFLTRWRTAIVTLPLPSRLTQSFRSEVNLHAMRLGPGKHLEGLSLFNGLVKPEEVGLVVSSWRWFS